MKGTKMKRQAMAMAALATTWLLATAPATVEAHPGGHGLTMGEVSSVRDDGFELKTEKETLKVRLTPDTKFEKDKNPVERSMLKTGVWVGVAVAKTDGGELTASRIVFGLAKGADAGKH
jgi:hypothetical protein